MKKTDLEKKLEEYDLSGVKFYTAKKRLIEEGYTEQEIVIAAASRPFDGKKNSSRPQDATAEILQKNPELAKEYAASLLEQENERLERERRNAVIKTSFSYPFGFGRINPVALHGLVDTAFWLGVPMYKLMGIGLFITAALYGLSTIAIVPLSLVWVFVRSYMLFVALFFIVCIAREEWASFRVKSRRADNHRVMNIIVFIVMVAYSCWAILSLLLFS